MSSFEVPALPRKISRSGRVRSGEVHSKRCGFCIAEEETKMVGAAPGYEDETPVREERDRRSKILLLQILFHVQVHQLLHSRLTQIIERQKGGRHVNTLGRLRPRIVIDRALSPWYAIWKGSCSTNESMYPAFRSASKVGELSNPTIFTLPAPPRDFIARVAPTALASFEAKMPSRSGCPARISSVMDKERV